MEASGCRHRHSEAPCAAVRKFLLRSLNPNATGDPNETLGDGPIERIFGHTSQAARLTIEEFVQINPCVTRKQDFVAIDRFTGGAADDAKFDALLRGRPDAQDQD